MKLELNTEQLELLEFILSEFEYEDDLIEEVTTASGWCIKSIDYEVQLK